MILEAAGGWAGRYRWKRSYGKVKITIILYIYVHH